MEHGVSEGGGKEQRYYTEIGRGCDFVLRCKDCQAIVTAETLHKLGCCTCGCKRVTEITILSEQEHADIAAGVIDFPYREQFLAEFTGVE